MPGQPTLNRFRKLVDDIALLYVKAREAQVRFAWETGRRIVEEEQKGEARAQYGAGLIPELSRALSAKCGPGFSERNLRNMRRFYRLHPIRQVTAKLDWTDYVELLPLKDQKTRRRLEKKAVRENLNTTQLRRLVRQVRGRRGPARKKIKEKAGPSAALKRPADLRLHTFARSALNVKSAKGLVLLDCGFFVHWPVSKDRLARLEVTDTPSYTYAATVERVIDGDTLIALIEAGFGIILREKLRLRGVDTAELGTPAGAKAKRFVSKTLPPGTGVVVRTHRSRTDTYGRFVADVFYKQGVSQGAAILEDPVYLNQELLDRGLAVRMRE